MKRTTYIFCLLLLTIFSGAYGYSVFEYNGKVGLKNEEGKVLIPAKYEALGWSQGGFSILSNVTGYRSAGKWGLISLSNHVLTKAEFEEIVPWDASLLVVRKKSATLRMVTGIMNTSGKEVIPFQYDDIQLSSLRAIVYSKIGNQYKCGLVDLENRTLIPQLFRKIKSIGSLRYAAENFENKWALFSDSGKQITPFTIDSISSFYRNYAIIYQGKNQGLIDRDGIIKIQPTHREIKIAEGSVHVRQSSTILFLDGQNTLYQKTLADSIKGIRKNLLKVSISGSIQLSDLKLQPISTVKITTLENFVNGNAIFSFENKFGVIKSDGSIIIEPKYTNLKRDGKYFLSNIKQGTKNNWMVLDSIGIPLHTKSYDGMLPLMGQVFPVVNKNFWGAMDTKGKEILSCTYDSIIQSKNENIVVKFHGQYGIINHREYWLVAPRTNKVRLVFDDRFIEYGPKTAYLKSFDNGIIYFSENKLETQENTLREYLPSGTIWEIGTNGVILNRILMPEGVEEIYPETEGLRGIKKNGQYGFVDSQGRLRIANRYEAVKPFSDQLAAMKIRGKWGFIGHDDRIIIQPIYDEVADFKRGLAVVKQKGLFGVVGRTGKQVLVPRYESVIVLDHQNILVTQNGLFGLADATGKMLINPKYHILNDLGNGYIIVARDGKYGAVTNQGISTIPLIYDHLSYDPFNDKFLALMNAEWVEVKL